MWDTKAIKVCEICRIELENEKDNFCKNCINLAPLYEKLSEQIDKLNNCISLPIPFNAFLMQTVMEKNPGLKWEPKKIGNISHYVKEQIENERQEILNIINTRIANQCLCKTCRKHRWGKQW